MSVEYPGLIHCMRCGRESEWFGFNYLVRGNDPAPHLYCPNEQCLGHTYGRSLYTVYVEFA